VARVVDSAEAVAAVGEEMVKLVQLDGREWLHAPSFPVAWAIIRATTADERGICRSSTRAR